MPNVLVAYFSASGVTAKVAQSLATKLQAELYEIKAKQAYTQADLNWQDKESRSSKEMRDKNSRPALADENAPIKDHTTIFLGFPIWWYVAPTIINTFLEAYDFTGKTIILFATSGSSGFGKAVEGLQASAPQAKFKEGRVFHGQASQAELDNWLQSLDLN